MRVTRFADPAAFYRRVEPFLIAHEAENNLIFGVLNGLRSGEFREQPPYMACVEQDGRIVLAALRTPPFNLVISTTDAPQALTPLIEDARRVYDRLVGILALSGLAEQAAQAWQAASGQTYHHSMAQRIYRLERVNPVGGVPGALRRADNSDRERMKRWFFAFQEETFGAADEQRVAQSIQRFLNAPPELRGLYFWEIAGQPVSMVGHAGPTPNGMRVGPVYTPPELRRRGYASACAAAVSQIVLDRGRRFCFLFTDLSNPTSNRIYQQIGYAPVCDVDEYHFDG